MSYLQDKKTKRNRTFQVSLFVVLLIALFFFRNSFWSKFSYTLHTILYPVLVVGNSIGDKFSGVHAALSFKNSLLNENENLKEELNKLQAQISNYNILL